MRVRRSEKAARPRAGASGVTGVGEDLDDSELARHWEAFCADVAPKAADVRRANVLAQRLENCVRGTRRVR